jgi:hypothetical protein
MATKRTVVDWATDLKAEQTQLQQLQHQLQRDEADVMRGRAAIARTEKKIEALKAELCIAAGIVPDRPRPDSGEPLDAAEMAQVHATMNEAQRELLEEPEARPCKPEVNHSGRE